MKQAMACPSSSSALSIWRPSRAPAVGVENAVIGGPHPMTCDTSELHGRGVSFCLSEAAKASWPAIILRVRSRASFGRSRASRLDDSESPGGQGRQRPSSCSRRTTFSKSVGFPRRISSNRELSVISSHLRRKVTPHCDSSRQVGLYLYPDRREVYPLRTISSCRAANKLTPAQCTLICGSAEKDRRATNPNRRDDDQHRSAFESDRDF